MKTNNCIKKILNGVAAAALLVVLIGSHRVVAQTETILYVRSAGNGDCLMWQSACHLRSALAVAQTGDEIWVAAGTYTPTGGTNRGVSFDLKSGVAVYGGFNGTETERSQRDWQANLTVLSGDIGTVGSTADNSYVVVRAANLDGGTVLDGFSITGANHWTGSGGSPELGGGMVNDHANPTLANLVFHHNSAGMGYGGGMANSYSHPTLRNVVFANNYADDGGGGMHNDHSDPLMIDVVFKDNFSMAAGGLLNASSSPTLINGSFTGNSSTNGGGMGNFASSPTLVNVVFVENYAEWGGAVTNWNSNPVLTQVTIYNNTAINGGGIYNYNNSAPQIRNSILWGNKLLYTWGKGAQIYNEASTPVIRSTLIEGGCPSGCSCDGSVIDGNPLFADAAAGDLHLVIGSPAINAGNTAYLPADSHDLDSDQDTLEPLPYDLDGNARVVSGTVDMGVYENTLAYPWNETPPEIEGEIGHYTILTASAGTWGGEVTGYSYRWQRGSTEEGGFDDIPGAQAASYTLTPADVLMYLRVEVSACNGEYCTAAYSAVVQVPNQAPVITEGESIAYTTGLVLHVSDADGDPVTWAIQRHPTVGIASVDAASGDVSYTASANCPQRILPFAVRASDGFEEDTIEILGTEGACLWLVDDSASGANNGTSWVDAFTSLQSALAVAQSGDEIWVAAGTYTPTGGTNRAVSFDLKSGVAVYGGFNGTETERSQRDWQANLTVLSGDIGVPGSAADNSYHVVTGTNLSTTTLLDGFTVQDGFSPESGGGIYLANSSPSLYHLVIKSNTAAQNGGGVFSYNSAPTLVNCVFFNNSAGFGGGFASQSSSGTPKIINCSFSGNHANDGGAIYNDPDGSDDGNAGQVRVYNSILWGDEANEILDVFYEYEDYDVICYWDPFEGEICEEIWYWVTIDANTETFLTNVGDHDPLFIDPDAGDLHLQGSAPNVNQGDQAYLPVDTFDLDGDGNLTERMPFDLDGEARIYGSAVDLGAYERQQMAPVIAEGKKQVFENGLTLHASDYEGSPLSWSVQTPPAQGDLILTPSPDQMSVTLTHQPADSCSWFTVQVTDGVDTDTIYLYYDDSQICIRYVDADAAGNQNGSSWSHAFTNLQDALQVALPGDEIWVAAGVYQPSAWVHRKASFKLKPGMAIYGGFAGRESERSQRDWQANITVLSGDLLGNDGSNFTNREDNSYHVVSFTPDSGGSPILDGFTVRGGNADDGGYAEGGGVYNRYGSARYKNLVLTDNTAVSGGGMGNYFSSPDLNNILFEHNRSNAFGGGLHNNENSSPHIVNSIFRNNQSYVGGGAANTNDSSPKIMNTIFVGNRANWHYPYGEGGGLFLSLGSITLTNTTFYGNIGFAVKVWYPSALMVNNSIIWGNSGGGVYIVGSPSLTIQNSIVQGRPGSSDPQFVNASAGDLGLMPGSPAIDAGNLAYLPQDRQDLDQDGNTTEPLPLDLAGKSRLRGANVDLGAYEALLAPVNLNPPEISGVQQHYVVLSASAGDWRDAPENTTYQWQRAAGESQPYANIQGANGAAYTLVRNDIGQVVRVRVTVCNQYGCAQAYSQPWIVNNDAPVISSSGVAEVAEDGVLVVGLAASDEDAEDNLLWALGSPPGHGVAWVSGSGVLTYQPHPDWHGEDQLVVVVSDGGASDRLAVTVTVPPVNDPPLNTTVPAITPASPAHGATLTANPGIWQDDKDGGEIGSVEYQWQKGDRADGLFGNITGAAEPTYDLTRVENGRFVRVRVRVCDTGDPGSTCATTYSPAVEVMNEAPVIDEEEITGELQAGGWLDVGLTVNDADGDELTWYLVNPPGRGSAVVDYHAGTIYYHPNSGFSGEDQFSVGVFDGQKSDVVLVRVVVDGGTSDRPVNTELPQVTPYEPMHEAVLTASDGGWSGPGTIRISYQWQKRGKESHIYHNLVGMTQNEYQLTRADKDCWMRVRVMACSVYGCSLAFSPDVQVVNQVPEITSQPIGEVAILEDRNYTTALAAEDGDGDILVWTMISAPGHGIAWVTSGGQLTYRPDPDYNGTDTMLAAVSDGVGSAYARIDLVIVAVNDRPRNTQPPLITPDQPGHGVEMSVDVGVWDDNADGGELQETLMQWQKAYNESGPYVDIVGATGAKYTLTRNEIGRYLRVRVRVCDQGVPGSLCVTQYTAPVMVANEPPQINQGEMLNLTLGTDGAMDETILTAQDGDGDTVTWTLTRPADHGYATVHAANGTLTYRPNPGFRDVDSFEVAAIDGGGIDTILIVVDCSQVVLYSVEKAVLNLRLPENQVETGKPFEINLIAMGGKPQSEQVFHLRIPQDVRLLQTGTSEGCTVSGSEVICTSLADQEGTADAWVFVVVDKPVAGKELFEFEAGLDDQQVTFSILVLPGLSFGQVVYLPWVGFEQ